MWNWIKALDRVLKGEATRPAALRGGSIELPLVGLTVLIVLLGAVYGASMGAFALVARWGTETRHVGYVQMAASAAKVPLLFVLTLVVTFPSLYVFNALVGSRLSFTTVLKLLVAALAVTMAVLASFATIVVFFSLCTNSYSFMVLLNVASFAVAGLLGMGFLLRTLNRLAVAQAMQALDALERPAAPPEPAAIDPPTDVPDGPPAPPYSHAPQPPPLPPLPPGALDRMGGEVLGRHVRKVFVVWVVVFGLVGSQMGWVLRPFIGNPAMPFTFFREREGSFFEAVIDRAADVLFNPSSSRPSHRSRGGGWNYDPGRGNPNPGAPVPPPATAPAPAPAPAPAERP